jgi:catechol 2,3-dioxygenase-like lactoylglutathione lyase family enzyme
MLDDLIAFAPVTDLDRARDFYASVLGLNLVDESPFACVFRIGPTMLRVTPIGKHVAAAYTVLGWSVADIDRVVRALVDRGVVFARYDGLEQDDLGVWTAPGGDRVAWFHDPDGNTLSLTQFV